MCIQDPPDVQLYTITGHLHKGGVRLPILQCSRGSTCLESFYLHLARFIPGTAASAVNFQAYLGDGIARWNTSQANAAIDCPQDSLRTFNVRLQHKVHVLQINHLYITLDLSPFLQINTLSESVYVSRYFQTFSHHRHTQESTTESSTSTTSRENPSSLET